MTWEKHIQHVLQKLSIFRGIVRKIRYFTTCQFKKNVYFAIANPYLQYGVHPGEIAQLIKKIQIQNFIVKLITKTPFPEEIIPALHETKNYMPFFNNILN